MTACGNCRLEMCFICIEPDDDEVGDCCCKGTFGRVTIGSPFLTGNLDEVEEKRGRGRPQMSGEDMKNAVAAGRARALDLAPIPEGYICEWALLEFAGGGVVPIVGCNGNFAHHRHHGPDKSTLNNAVGINLHRVCDDCHNRWHELNDCYYDDRPSDNSEFLPKTSKGSVTPHDRMTRADDKTQALAQMWWATPKVERKEYRSW